MTRDETKAFWIEAYSHLIGGDPDSTQGSKATWTPGPWRDEPFNVDVYTGKWFIPGGGRGGYIDALKQLHKLGLLNLGVPGVK